MAVAAPHPAGTPADEQPPLLIRDAQDQLGYLDVIGQPGHPVDQLRGVGGPATDDSQLHPNALTSAPLRATWQAASWSAASWLSSGVTWHSSIASGHRQRNRQPGVGSMTRGGSPPSVSAGTFRGARGSGTAASSSWVEGCRGLA